MPLSSVLAVVRPCVQMLRRTLCYPGTITAFVQPEKWMAAALDAEDEALIEAKGDMAALLIANNDDMSIYTAVRD